MRAVACAGSGKAELSFPPLAISALHKKMGVLITHAFALPAALVLFANQVPCQAAVVRACVSSQGIPAG